MNNFYNYKAKTSILSDDGIKKHYIGTLKMLRQGKDCATFTSNDGGIIIEYLKKELKVKTKEYVMEIIPNTYSDTIIKTPYGSINAQIFCNNLDYAFYPSLITINCNYALSLNGQTEQRLLKIDIKF